MKLGLKNILSITIGVLGTTYFLDKTINAVIAILPKKDETPVIEDNSPETPETAE